jgi:hypothetical protein
VAEERDPQRSATVTLPNDASRARPLPRHEWESVYYLAFEPLLASVGVASGDEGLGGMAGAWLGMGVAA